MKLNTIFAVLLLVVSQVARAGDKTELPILFPFISDGKWGYIDATGAWAIEPRFGRCIEMFEGERVRVWENNKWGYIDRTGKWIVEPLYNEPTLGRENDAFEIVFIGKKQGILAHAGNLVLPVKYDDIVTFGSRAWVRSGEKLGMFALDGHWIFKPSMEWPSRREMPIPAEGDVSWFKRGKKWGLLSREGKVLFAPQFAEHVLGRKESESWDHPEGLDFKSGRAWVMVEKEYQLITDDGRVQVRNAYQSVKPWTKDAYIFTQKDGNSGLVSKDGQILLPAKYPNIRPPNEGLAVISEHRRKMKPNGGIDDWWDYGFINEQGKIIIGLGTYLGSGETRGGGQTELASFSEGFTPVWNNSPEGQKSDIYDPRAGYIDKTGALHIAETFYMTESFSDGLGAFLERKPRENSPWSDSGLWGYVDPAGAVAIPPQFRWTSKFCQNRAWVVKAGGLWDQPQWAMIDRTGKVLTDYSFDPPERHNQWEYSTGFSSQTEWLRHTRWRGDLAVISRGDFHHGLATADGKVLVEPIFNRIGEFHDGVAVAVDSRGRDANGDVKFVTALISERGEILANDTYTSVADFDHGTAWASHRWTDHRGPIQHEGWGLIDPSAKELCELKYVGANWIWSREDHYSEDRCPKFYGELAPVALVDGFQQYGDQVWLLNSWGYMNRAGKIVAWHEKVSGK
ncbi:MAG: WG repeat-containing protein [Luteolibacter sp.]